VARLRRGDAWTAIEGFYPHAPPHQRGEDCRCLVERPTESLGGERSVLELKRSQGDMQLAIGDADVACNGFAPFLDLHDIAAAEDWGARLGGPSIGSPARLRFWTTVVRFTTRSKLSRLLPYHAPRHAGRRSPAMSALVTGRPAPSVPRRELERRLAGHRSLML
jgi:hypothetical protein